MKNNFRRHRPRTSSQEGQTFIPIAVMILLLLLGMMGVAIDYSQLWAHRQMAQGAADAACQAGAADLYLNAIDPAASGLNGLQNFKWIGTAFDCSTSPSTPPCQYANLNGYNGLNGNPVNVSFPATLPNAPTLTGGPFAGTPTPYIQVTVTDQVPMTLTQLLRPNPTVTITATAGCGLVPVNMPTPLLILNTTAPDALTLNGASNITIFGGPQRSIQVNSNATTAINIGSGGVDLSQGGPKDSGSDFAVFGGPQTKPSTINVGTSGTGHYIDPALPVGDPFAAVKPPDPKTLATGSVRAVPLSINGCPDPNGCVEFTAGDYTGCKTANNLQPGDEGCLLLPYQGSNPGLKVAEPDWVAGQAYSAGALIEPTNNNTGNYIFIAMNNGTSGGGKGPNWSLTTPCSRQADGTCSGQTVTETSGLQWQNVGVVTSGKSNIQLATAIFDPGIYYVADAKGLQLGDGSTVRVSTATGDGSQGVMFYFNSAGTVSVTSNSGKSAACTSADNSGNATPAGCIVSYQKSGALSTQANGALPAQKLQCPSGSTDISQVPIVMDGNILLGPCGPPTPSNPDSLAYGSPDGNRGFLFFQNRTVSAQPSWGGGGQFLSSGFMYFHSGNGTNPGTDTTLLTLRGGSGSQSFTLGDIVVDELLLKGNPQINMILNPASTFKALEPTLIQ